MKSFFLHFVQMLICFKNIQIFPATFSVMAEVRSVTCRETKNQRCRRRGRKRRGRKRCRRRGRKRTAKSFHLSKTWGKIPENPGKNEAQRLTCFLQNQRKTQDRFFCRSHQTKVKIPENAGKNEETHSCGSLITKSADLGSGAASILPRRAELIDADKNGKIVERIKTGKSG